MKKRLKDVLDYEQPTKYIVDSQNYSEDFMTPVLTAGKSFILGYTDETEGVYEASKNPVIIFDDFTSASKYVDFDFKVKSSAMKILHLVNPKDSLRYVYYAMQKIDYVPFSHKRLWISDYCNFEIELPDSSIQNRVVADLDTIQKAIDIKRKQLEDLDELMKSKFQEMFGDPVENEKGWDVKSFGELATFKNGLNYSPKGDGVKYYIIGVSDFQSRSEIGCNEELLSIYLEGTLNEEYLLQDDDILFVRSNGNKQLIARNILVKTNMLEVTFSGFCIRARIVKGDVLPCFVNSLLKIPSSHDALTMKGRGCNISNLNQAILNDFGIIVPPIEQQKVFAEFVRKADAANAIIKQEISDLEELMDSKMDEYFG